MFDLYSKIVLTVIAVALAVIAVALAVIAWESVSDAPAHAAFGETCGSITDPCYVNINSSEKLTVEIDAGFAGVPVDVQNWPIR